jgi:hypothetical protein
VGIIGNVALPDGISLPADGTNPLVSFTSPLRFGGEVASNVSSTNAFWRLSSDWLCDSTFSLNKILNLSGNGQAMKLSNTLLLDGNTAGLCLVDDVIIDGQGNSIAWLSPDGPQPRLSIDLGVSVTLRNATLYFGTPMVSGGVSVDPGTWQPINFDLFFGSGTPSLTHDNVTIVLPRGNVTYAFPGYNFVCGSIVGHRTGYLFIKNEVRLVGARGATFQYGCSLSFEATLPLTILPDSELSIGPGVNFSYKPYSGGSRSGDNSLIRMVDSTSRLRFDNSTLTVSNLSGLQFLKGMVTFDNLVSVVNTGATSTTGCGIIFGDGTAENDVDVRVLSGATIVVDGFLQYAHS